MSQDVLTRAAEEMIGEREVRPVLERALGAALGLLDVDAGSVCTVDEGSGGYRKEVDAGVPCLSGRWFPLTEGTTGLVVAARGPVLLDDYREVPRGHVPPAARARLRGVLGVPIWWRGGIVGSLVLFAGGRGRRFDHDDAELLASLAGFTSIAIAGARYGQDRQRQTWAAATAAERDRAARDVHGAVSRGLADVTRHLDRAHSALPDGGEPVRGSIRAARQAVRATLDSARDAALRPGAIDAGGAGSAGADPDRDPDTAAVVSAAALTPREAEVAALVRQGLPDKAIARLLTISTKTVEKHVGAVLRKTGSRNRTDYVARHR